MFRELHTFMQATTKGRGRVEVVSFAVTAEGATAEEFAASATTHASTTSTTSASHHVMSSPSHAAPAPMSAATTSQQLPMASPGKRAPAARGAGAGAGADAGSSGGEVVYARGPIAGIPEAHASRKERFAELDNLQPGWEVELKSKGDTVEAVFYAPGSGECVGAYANARRMALAASKAAKGGQ